MFNVTDYWPDPKPGQNIVFKYTPLSGIQATSVFSLGLDGEMRLEDFQNDVWQDTWYLRRDPIRGMLEVGDDMRTKTWVDKLLLGPIKKLRYVPGKEIIWGGPQNVGDVIGGPIEVDVFASRRLPPFVRTPDCFGWQTIQFESLTDDILQFTYVQMFDNNPTPYGGRYFMKKGVGPIKIQWRMPDGSFTDPVTATVT